jgi:hypothetical protein
MALVDNLVLFYSLEDDAASTTVTDAHASYDGTAQQNTSILSTAGKVDNCLSFNGTSDYIQMPNITGEFSDEASACMWVKLNSYPHTVQTKCGIAFLGDAVSQTVIWTDGKFYCGWFRDDRLAGVDLSPYVSEDTWFMLTVTQKPGADGYKIYVDTTEIYSGTGESSVTIHSTARLGLQASAYYLDGYLDQVGIWSKALTSDEVSELYNDGDGLTYENLVGYCRFGHKFFGGPRATLGHEFNIDGITTDGAFAHQFEVLHFVGVVSLQNDQDGTPGSMSTAYVPRRRSDGADLDAGYYDFDGSSDALRLTGTDADAATFDPSQNSNDFTIAGQITPDVISGYGGIFCKRDDLISNGVCWACFQNSATMTFGISKDGTAGGGSWTGVNAGTFVADQLMFFCGRYQYVADGTSDIRLNVDGSETSNTSAFGPVHSNTGSDVQIADWDYSTPTNFNGSIHWLAYWNRKLSDLEVYWLENNFKRPEDLNPDFYIDFHQAVASTYEGEIGWITFDVEGTPTQGGSTDTTLYSIDALESSVERGVIETEEIPDKYAIEPFSSTRASPLESSTERGIVNRFERKRNKP